MKRTFRSTRVPITGSRDKALLVAQEFEEAGRKGRGFVTREQFQRQLDSIMRLAGVDSHYKVSSWEEFSLRWLSQSSASSSSLPLYRRQIQLFSDWLGPRAKDDLRRLTSDDLDSYQAWIRQKLGGHASYAALIW